ncbi:formin-like protein 1, partial [Morus notabilis]|uniref:formin-like protein 1 n=1 Tax=Morus notabilis TaxID=981085 RepID=UPI000CED77B6
MAWCISHELYSLQRIARFPFLPLLRRFSAAAFSGDVRLFPSLILPHSSSPKSSSHKLVALSIAAVVSALVVLAIAVFFYRRRRSRRSDLSEDKTFRSENSSRLFPASNAERTNTRAQKLRTGSAASSEFLYLGTLVDSRRIDEGVNPSSNGEREDRFDARKMESPELHPLPPLARQNLGLNSGNNGTEVNSTADDEEEEFYSPRGSLGGRDSSIGTGSGSRRAFAAVAGENFKGRNSGSSEASRTSSCSASPDRSHSISYSPPVCSSPKRAEFKSSVSSDLQAPPPPPPPQPQMANEKTVISPFSSPGKVSEKNSVVSPRISNVSHENVRSPSLSPLSSSPDRALKGYTGTFDGFRPSPLQSSASSSPERGLEKIPEASLTKQSPSLSSSSSSERALQGHSEVSPRTSNASERKWQVFSPSPPSRSPERDSPKNSDAKSIISNDSVGFSF